MSDVDDAITSEAIEALDEAIRRVRADWPNVGGDDALHAAATDVVGDARAATVYKRATSFIEPLLPEPQVFAEWAEARGRTLAPVVDVLRAAKRRAKERLEWRTVGTPWAGVPPCPRGQIERLKTRLDSVTVGDGVSPLKGR